MDFFAALGASGLCRSGILRCGLHLIELVIERELRSGAFEGLDRSGLGVERLLVVGISCLDVGSAKLDRLFCALDIV